jgi:glycosyltransferase involved in cell wall biosynthesis
MEIENGAHKGADGSGLRILFVNSGLRFGGAETQLIAILQELKRRGHSPSIYLLTGDAPRLGDLVEHGIPVILDDKRSRLDLGVLRRLRRHIRQLKPDLVHGFLFDANIYARIAGWGQQVPVLNSERNHGYQLRPAQRWIHAATRRWVDGVIANSHAGRRFAETMFALPSDRTHTVWNGVDLAAIDRRVAASKAGYRKEFFGDSGVRMAVLIGTISAQKDHLLAIDVAEHLCDADPTWRVAFVGASYGAKLAYASGTALASNTLDREVAARAQSSRHADRIRFVGQRRDALEIIADADILFCTSRHEGFPNVVLEAMSTRTPVVSTRYSDIDLILPAELVVPIRDPEAMAQAMQWAAGAGAAQIGGALRTWVEAHATIERSVDALEMVYRQYLRNQAKGVLP